MLRKKRRGGGRESGPYCSLRTSGKRLPFTQYVDIFYIVPVRNIIYYRYIQIHYNYAPILHRHHPRRILTSTSFRKTLLFVAASTAKSWIVLIIERRLQHTHFILLTPRAIIVAHQPVTTVGHYTAQVMEYFISYYKSVRFYSNYHKHDSALVMYSIYDIMLWNGHSSPPLYI